MLKVKNGNLGVNKMKQYNEYEKEFPEVQLIKPIYVYVTYVNKKLEYFNTLEEANKVGKVVDKEHVNEQEVKASKKAFSDRGVNIYNAWYNDLVNECQTLAATGTFKDFLSNINDYGSSDDMDIVAEQMIENERLANKIVGMVK